MDERGESILQPDRHRMPEEVRRIEDRSLAVMAKYRQAVEGLNEIFCTQCDFEDRVIVFAIVKISRPVR